MTYRRKYGDSDLQGKQSSNTLLNKDWKTIRSGKELKKLATIAVFLLTVVALIAGGARPVAADQSTRIYNFTAYESGGVVNIRGVLQYRDPSGNFIPLNATKVKFYWWTTGSVSTNYIGEAYSDDKTSLDPGWFQYAWLHGLEPGKYYLRGTYEGGDSYTATNGVTYTFQSCQDDIQFRIPLRLSIALDNPTRSVASRASVKVTLTVAAVNSNNPHPVSVSIKDPSNNFVSGKFSPLSGNTPLVSKLTLNVPNLTQPGTYMVTIVATSQENSSVTVSTPLLIFVQQNTYTITVEIQNLPTTVQTPLYLDDSYIENLGPGLGSLTISDKTRIISVSKEIVSGDTLYSCQDYRKAVGSWTGAAMSATSFTFSYDIKHRLKISSDLPQKIISKLVLIVNGTDQTNDHFNPAQGYNDFLSQGALVSFAITPSYITTSDVNYKLREWKDLTTGQLMKPVNATTGVYDIILTRPTYLEAYYDKWVVVTIKTNLPADMSTKLQIGVEGSEKEPLNVIGSVAYPAGEFIAGSTFECVVDQDQFVLSNSGENIRYAFQGLNPPPPVTLEKHITINITYAIKYKVEVIPNSVGASSILQPPGGVGWFASGDIATLQVRNEAKDKNGILYVFDGWTGSLSSGKTLVSFPVTAPMQIETRWKLNWAYFLTLGVAIIGVIAPTTMIIKKTICEWKELSKKNYTKARNQKATCVDQKLHKYIIERGGSIKISDAVKELHVTREEIKDSIRRLKQTRLRRD